MNSRIIKTRYRVYKDYLRQTGQTMSKELGRKIEIAPTPKKICRQNGILKEVSNSISTARYLQTVYEQIKQKGYQIPKILIDEKQISRKSNLAGFQTGNWNVFGPGKLDLMTPSYVLHEEGHYLHKQKLFNQPLYSLFSSVRNIFRPFLNKSEKNILTEDYMRAYNEGYFRHLPMKESLDRGYIKPETYEDFSVNPKKYLVRNALSSMDEFIAEYFSLAVQGFKFSPEITKRYKYFHGPEIQQTFSPNEIDKLVARRKDLEWLNVII